MKPVSEEAVIRLIGDAFGGLHCTSCHEDAAMGYPMVEIDLGKGRYAEVCCYVHEDYLEWLAEKNDKRALV